MTIYEAQKNIIIEQIQRLKDNICLMQHTCIQYISSEDLILIQSFIKQLADMTEYTLTANKDRKGRENGKRKEQR